MRLGTVFPSVLITFTSGKHLLVKIKEGNDGDKDAFGNDYFESKGKMSELDNDDPTTAKQPKEVNSLFATKKPREVNSFFATKKPREVHSFFAAPLHRKNVEEHSNEYPHTRCIKGCPCHECRRMDGSTMHIGDQACAIWKDKACLWRGSDCDYLKPKLCKCSCNGTVECVDNDQCTFEFEAREHHKRSNSKEKPTPCIEGCHCELCDDVFKGDWNNPWFAIPGETLRFDVQVFLK